MFRYKSVKHKSNYLCVKIPFNVNGFSQTEYTLVLPLFGGEHSVSMRFEVGNGYTGEAVFHYAYDKGVIKVCSYDWDKKDEIPYEVPPHYTRPHLNLYKADSNSQEPALTVSSDNSTALRCNANDSFLLNTVEPIKANLRTIHDYVQEALKKTGVSLRTHVDDVVERDEEGNIVGGRATGVSRNWTGYFYNIDGSSTPYPGDRPQGGGTWIDYYRMNTRWLQNYCASSRHNNFGCHGQNCRPSAYGGHIFITSQSIRLMIKKFFRSLSTANITGYNRNFHQISIGGTYYMLPICSWHNNAGRYDIVMHTFQGESLLNLTDYKL